MRARYTRLPPSSVDARTDNRYSVTPTLAGDKGLNGRPADARVTPTVMHRRNAPTRSVDLERAALCRTALCPSVYSFFVTKARYPACARHVKGARTHTRPLTHACTELRNSERSTRPKERETGDDTFPRIGERRRSGSVHSYETPGSCPAHLSWQNVFSRRRDTNSCLVSIATRFTVQNWLSDREKS